MIKFLIAVLAASTFCKANQPRTLLLSPLQIAKVTIAPGRTTILSFPMKPSKVILGNKGVFAVEYVDNDLAIAALTTASRSNLFVYVDSRRFGFDLTTSEKNADEIILVRDASENRMRVKIK